MLKKFNLINLLIVFISLIFFLISILNFNFLFFVENSENSFLWGRIFFFIYGLVIAILGFLSLFLKKYFSKLIRIFGATLMFLFIFFPFLVITEVFSSIIIYLLSTIGMFLFLRSK